MAFYLGNIRANEEALDDLAKSVDVQVTVANSTGQNQSGLNIATLRQENFTNNPYLKDFRYNGVAVGAYGEEARQKPVESEAGNDTAIVGVNCMECLWDVTECEFMDGYDEGFFAGNEPLCIMYSEFAKRNDIEPGDQVTLPVYMIYRRDGGAKDYPSIGEQTIKVIGIFESVAPMDMYVPVQWLREAAEGAGAVHSRCPDHMRSVPALRRRREHTGPCADTAVRRFHAADRHGLRGRLCLNSAYDSYSARGAKRSCSSC